MYLSHELALMGHRVEIYGDPPIDDWTVGNPRDYDRSIDRDRDRSRDRDSGSGYDCDRGDCGNGNGNGNDSNSARNNGSRSHCGEVLWFHHSQVY